MNNKEDQQHIIDQQQKQIDQLKSVVNKLAVNLKAVAKDTARAKNMSIRNQSNISTLTGAIERMQR